MDSNGSRFQLLLTQNDWAACRSPDGAMVFGPEAEASSGLEWQRGSVALQALPFVFPLPAGRMVLGLEARRGAARDAYGNVYWSSGPELRVWSSGSGRVSHFWSAQDDREEPTQGGVFTPAPGAKLPPTELTFQGLCVTADHYLLAGVSELEPGRPGWLVFDLHGGGPPRVLEWPRAPAAQDVCARPGGGAFVLGSDGTLWTLDRSLRVVAGPSSGSTSPETFQPSESGQTRLQPPATAPLAHDLSGLGQVIAAEALSCDELLLLTRSRQVYQLRLGQSPLPVPVRRGELLPGRPAHDFLLVTPAQCSAAGDLGTLYLVLDDGEQAMRMRLVRAATGLELDFDPCYFPLRSYAGQSLIGGLVAADQAARAFYLYQPASHQGTDQATTQGERWLPLSAQARPRHVSSATLLTPVLDGHTPGCVWHRLMLDVALPGGCSVQVRSRAADAVDQLGSLPWQTEPLPYRRANGSELPFVQNGTGDYDTFELLFQQARGQHLQLELRLSGDGRHTPMLRALRAWYPRFSYLSYLPGAYRRNAGSADFLERFLANLEGVYTELEGRVAAVQALFSAAGAPPEALDWLAGWFGMVLDPAWPEAKRRLLLRHALRFFQARGTLRGLHLALRLAFEERPPDDLFEQPLPASWRRGVRLVERFRTVRVGAAGRHDSCREPDTLYWTPAQPDTLNDLYRASVQASAESWGLDAVTTQLYPLSPPAQPTERAFWTTFSQGVLGFVPAAGSADVSRWRAFLERRYGAIERLNAAYQGYLPGSQVVDFASLTLPTSLPAGGAPVLDWYEFETQILPRERVAHRFRVLVPVPAGRQVQTAELRSQLELARRVIELEKPAHTAFDLEFYWAMFRVGEARTGQDTVLEFGSRALPFVLGLDHLAEAFLTSSLPEAPGRLRL